MTIPSGPGASRVPARGGTRTGTAGDESTIVLRRVASQVRTDILLMIAGAGSGHPGGSLSAVEILVELYFRRMRLLPDNPRHPDRDRFVLSKGHACPALYSVLARRGLIPPPELATLRKAGSRLQGHPDMLMLDCLDASTGSLGQGFSVAVGMARGLRMLGSPARVYCLLGDGELQEGMVWESAASAAHAGLSNITAVVDANGVQLDGRLEEIKDMEPLRPRWASWGWHTLEADGHSFESLGEAFEGALEAPGPSVVIARTVKGRGVSFMEGSSAWHGRCPDREELARALREVGGDG